MRCVTAALLCCALALALLLPAAPTHAAQPHGDQERGLLSSLSHYEVVHVASQSHSLSGPPAPARRAANTFSAGSADAHAAPWELSHEASTLGHQSSAPRAPPQHPREHKFGFDAHGMRFDVHLRKNEELFGPRYSETRQHWVNGVRQRHLEQPARPVTMVEHCYYKGNIAADEHAEVAVNTCNHGFSGVMRTGGETYVVEPAHAHLSAPQLLHHASRVQTTMARNDDGEQEEVNVNALHVVYKLSDARPIRGDTLHEDLQKITSTEGASRHLSEKIDTIGTSSLVHECGVDYPGISQVGIQGMSFPSADHGASQAGPALNPFTRAAAAANQKPAHLNRASTPPAKRYIELLVANDNLRYKALGVTTEQRSANIANIMSSMYGNTVFTPSRLELVLQGQVTFFNQDPWNITLGGCSGANVLEMCVDKLLPKWNEWRRNPDNTQPYQFHDTGHLFSGHNFQGSVLGYAGVSTMCTVATSGGINQMDAEDAFNAAIGAHEIGHNLGMQHDKVDTNGCASSGKIMNAIVDRSQPTPTAFSTCSVNYYTIFSNNGGGSCMDNEPTVKYGDPICGNGYVEVGEACDCGPYDSGIDSTNVDPNFCMNKGNPCCDPLSCQFTDESECSNSDSCCTDCKITTKEQNVTCRTAGNSCDVAEICDGTSSECPFDDGVGNGLGCSSELHGAGACFNGDCVSFAAQCAGLNTIVNGGPWVPCPVHELSNEQNYGLGYCGVLQCSPRALVNSGADIRSCNHFTLSSANERIADGVPCGPAGDDGSRSNSQLCYNSQCVSAVDTNVRFQWRTSNWADCDDCDTTQERNVSCVHVASGTVHDDVYCAAAFRPATVQRCSDPELLCEHSLSGSIELVLFGRTILISSPLVMGVSAGIFVILMLGMHLCVNAVANPQHAHGLKRRKSSSDGQPLAPSSSKKAVHDRSTARQQKQPAGKKSVFALA